MFLLLTVLDFRCPLSVYSQIDIGCGIKIVAAFVSAKNPPAPKVLGRDLPDGTRKRLQVYLGGAFFGQNLLFLIGRDARLQKTL